MATGDIPPKTRARLRLGENPYAFAEFEDDGLAEAPSRGQVRGNSDPKPSRDHGRQPDLFAQPLPANYERVSGRSGNPYARIGQSYQDDAQAEQPEVDAKSQSLSKLEFRRRCTEIFRAYIPDLEGGSLRRYMGDFITRNEGRSSRIRYLLVKALSKFDLSDLSATTPLFNREDETLSEQKLRDIERSVGEDE